jgi:hypothetical protein
MAPLVNSVLGGDAAAVPAELRRMGDKGLNAVGLLLAFERRVAQLVQLAARLGNRRDVRALLDEEKNARRVMWKDVPIWPCNCRNGAAMILKNWREGWPNAPRAAWQQPIGRIAVGTGAGADRQFGGPAALTARCGAIRTRRYFGHNRIQCFVRPIG